jgi:hypothetical protein
MFNVYRDGMVHVNKIACKTCIFRRRTRPVGAARVKEMVKKATADNSAIICHSTLYGGIDNAVCRGFFDRHKTGVLQIAERMGAIKFEEGSLEKSK